MEPLLGLNQRIPMRCMDCGQRWSHRATIGREIVMLDFLYGARQGERVLLWAVWLCRSCATLPKWRAWSSATEPAEPEPLELQEARLHAEAAWRRQIVATGVLARKNEPLEEEREAG